MINVKKKRKKFDVSDIESQKGKTIRREKKKKQRRRKEEKRKEKRQWSYKSPTASKTYKTCRGLTNKPRYSAVDTSDTDGDPLPIRFFLSILHASPSRFVPL